MKTRICIKCNRRKELKYLRANKTSKYGRMRCCKDCANSYRMKVYPDSHSRFQFGGQRKVVLERDNGKCVECGMSRGEHRLQFGRDITVDHIDGNGRYSDSQNNSLDNLQTLCLPCHGRKSMLVDARKLKSAVL